MGLGVKVMLLMTTPNAEFPMINTKNMAEARNSEVGATLVLLIESGFNKD